MLIVATAALALALAPAAPAQAQPAAPSRSAAADPAEMECVKSELSPMSRMLIGSKYSSRASEDREAMARALAPALANCSARYGWQEKRRQYGADYAGQVLDLEFRVKTLEQSGVTAEKLDQAFMSLAQEDRFGLTDTGSAELSEEAIRALLARIDGKLSAAGFSADRHDEIRSFLIGYARLYELGGIWNALAERGIK